MRHASFNALRRRCASEDGNVSVEVLLFAPVFAASFLSVATLWDGFGARTDSLRATYAVADALARTSDAITRSEIDELEDLFAFVARSEGDAAAIRVSVVSQGLEDDGTTPRLDLDWSYSTGTGLPAAQGIETVRALVPEMEVGDQVIITESYNAWLPLWGASDEAEEEDGMFSAWEFREAVAMRPRFAAQVLFDD